MQPSTKRSECDNEFGGIAESGIEKPSNAFAHTFGELLRSAAHPAGKR
jgi:hypothetical protein